MGSVDRVISFLTQNLGLNRAQNTDDVLGRPDSPEPRQAEATSMVDCRPMQASLDSADLDALLRPLSDKSSSDGDISAALVELDQRIPKMHREKIGVALSRLAAHTCANLKGKLQAQALDMLNTHLSCTTPPHRLQALVCLANGFMIGMPMPGIQNQGISEPANQTQAMAIIQEHFPVSATDPQSMFLASSLVQSLVKALWTSRLNPDMHAAIIAFISRHPFGLGMEKQIKDNVIMNLQKAQSGRTIAESDNQKLRELLSALNTA